MRLLSETRDSTYWIIILKLYLDDDRSRETRYRWMNCDVIKLIIFLVGNYFYSANYWLLKKICTLWFVLKTILFFSISFSILSCIFDRSRWRLIAWMSSMRFYLAPLMYYYYQYVSVYRLVIKIATPSLFMCACI